MTFSVCSVCVIDTCKNGSFNSGFTEKGLCVGANVNILTSPLWGESSAFVSGGNTPTTSTSFIEKYPVTQLFSAAVSSGNLTASRAGSRIGVSSKQHGYHTGGFVLPNSFSNVIDKFPFPSCANATDVGDLNGSVSAVAGISSVTHGYAAGGNQPVNPNLQRRIDKFPFSTDTNATNIGNLCACRSAASSSSSVDAGYVASGENSASGGYANYIERFPFASETSISNIGTTGICTYGSGGHSSSTDGYMVGGKFPPNTFYTNIQKYPFSTSVAASCVGGLGTGRLNFASSSSNTAGLSAGGEGSPGIIFGSALTVEKFPFASPTSQSNVGDLACCRSGMTGTQV